MKRLRALSVLATLALVVAACSSDASDDTTTTSSAAETTTTMAEEMMEETIVDVAAGIDDFSTLVAAVTAADLGGALSDMDTELTVFAPTNAAFEDALAALDLTAEELLADTDTLTSILTYHVVDGKVLSSDLAADEDGEITVTTLSGEELTILVGEDGSVSFDGQTATVTTADVEAANGVIHVIDAVLLPPSMTN